MIKNITTFGDSFTYGEELSNRDNAYPYKLGFLCGANVINEGKPGSGNKRIIRKVMEVVADTAGEDTAPDLIVIGWSSPGRMEFADADGIYDIWPGCTGNLFRGEGQQWRMDLLNYINMYHSPEYIYQQYLQDVILLQNFLEHRGIKYIMMTTCSNEYYHKTWYSTMPKLAGLVNPNTYLGWPKEGMAEWTNGCARGPNGHFLDDGHKRVAVKLFQHIKANGWV